MSQRATFTVTFKAAFGPRAIEVARQQLASAFAGEQHAVWQAILDDLIAQDRDMYDAGGTHDGPAAGA